MGRNELEQAAEDLIFFMKNAAAKITVQKKTSYPEPLYPASCDDYNMGDNPDFELQTLQELFGLQLSDNSVNASTSTGVEMSGFEHSSYVIDSRHYETDTDAIEIPQWSYCIQRNETSSIEIYESQFHLDRTVFPYSNEVEQQMLLPMRTPHHSDQMETDHYHAKTFSSTSYVEPFISTFPKNDVEKIEQRTNLHLQFENYYPTNNRFPAQDKKQLSATSKSGRNHQMYTSSTSIQQRLPDVDYERTLMVNGGSCKEGYQSPNVKKETLVSERKSNLQSIDAKNLESQSYKELLNLKEYFLDQIRYCDIERKQIDMQFIADMKARHYTREITYSEMIHDVQRLHDIAQELKHRQHFEGRSSSQLSSQPSCDVKHNEFQTLHDGKRASCGKARTTKPEYGIVYQKVSKPSSKTRQMKSRRCYFCRKPGHFIEHCAKAAQVMTMPVNTDRLETQFFYSYQTINVD